MYKNITGYRYIFSMFYYFFYENKTEQKLKLRKILKTGNEPLKYDLCL